jgi:hypothetical protein
MRVLFIAVLSAVVLLVAAVFPALAEAGLTVKDLVEIAIESPGPCDACAVAGRTASDSAKLCSRRSGLHLWESGQQQKFQFGGPHSQHH